MTLRTAVLFLCLLVFSGCSGTSTQPATTQTTTTTTTPPSSTPPVQTVPLAKPKFAYTVNETTADVHGYSVDPASGALTPLAGFPVASGVNPIYILHDPSGKFAAVADIAADRLHVYSINSTTGMLTEVGPSPYATFREPRALAFDPTGRFLYVTSQYLGSVAAYVMDANGALTPVKGSPFATGTGSYSTGDDVIVDLTGRFVFVADAANITSFSLDATTGALTLVNTVAGPKSAGGLALDPGGAYLYAVGSGTNSIVTFAIDKTSGAISLASTSPMLLKNGAYTISIDPTGSFAYTVESGLKLVAYKIANGSFTGIASYAGALGTSQLAIDPSGSFVYAPQTGTSNNISGFQIGATGALTALTGSPMPTGVWPFSMTITSQ